MRSLLRPVALFGLAFLCPCSSLLTIVPDLSPRADPHLQLEGTRGPLTTERSKAIVDQLQSNGAPTNIFEMHLALEQAIVGSPLTIDNKVSLLQDGPNT